MELFGCCSRETEIHQCTRGAQGGSVTSGAGVCRIVAPANFAPTMRHAMSQQGRARRGYSHRRNRPQSCHSCSELTDITSSRQRARYTNGPCESLRWAPPRRDSRSIESPHVPRRDSRSRESPRGAPPRGATQVAVSRGTPPRGDTRTVNRPAGVAMRSPSAARDRERLRDSGSKTLKSAGGAPNPRYP